VNLLLNAMFVSRCDKVIVKCNTVADEVRCPQKIKNKNINN